MCVVNDKGNFETMHDTALEIGRAAIEMYSGGNGSRILEIGAMDVNGSLRQFRPDGSKYLGVDLEPGKGVDMIVEPGKPLPFAEGSFDLVLASSVFEHDPAFWVTFLDLIRVLRDGGHLYISAPSNGHVHRYPEDHWRFYPDSGRALERWAASQDLPVRLIESFTAPRKNDMWNDFVAVFRKGNDDGNLCGQFLHAEFNGVNVWTLGAAQPLKSVAPTQDMELLQAERANAKRLDAELAAERDRTAKGVEEAIREAASNAATLESTLRQREEEIEQTRRERDEARAAAEQAAKLQTKLEHADAWIFQTAGERRKDQALLRRAEARAAKAEAELVSLEGAYRSVLDSLRRAQDKQNELGARLQVLTSELVQERAKPAGSSDSSPAMLTAAQERLEARFAELATMTRLLKAAEANDRRSAESNEWLVKVSALLAGCPRWWALLPRSWRRNKEHARLKRRSLFDAKAYLELHPDVADEGIDPVLHYMLHGIGEGRTLVR